MTSKTLSQLPPSGPLVGDELVFGVQDGLPVRLTVSQLIQVADVSAQIALDASADIVAKRDATIAASIAADASADIALLAASEASGSAAVFAIQFAQMASNLIQTQTIIATHSAFN